MYIRDEVAIKAFPKAKERNAFYNVYNAFTNRGLMKDDKGDADYFELRDLVTQQGLTRFIPQSIEVVVREALEPNLFIVDRLFQPVHIPRGTRIQIGAVGAMEAARVDQGGEYKEKFMDLDGGNMIGLTTHKHGLKISMTQEVLDDNLFDVVGIWLRAAGRALARHKERQGAKIINEIGYDVYDNMDPLNSYLGNTTGRDISGTPNGTMTVNDVFGMYTYLLHRGFNPNVLMMHPFAWKTFMTDTEMREVVLQGSTVTSVRNPAGSYAENWGTSHEGYGLRTTATGYSETSGNQVKGGNAWTQTLNPLGATFNIAPSYLPSPVEVIVTPYIPFRVGNRGDASAGNESTRGSMSNLVMVDSSNCGIIGQSMPVTVDKWTDPERDIENVKLREAYGFAVLEQGKSIAVARNVSTERNYNFENSNNQTLSEITKDSGIIPNLGNSL